MIISDTIMAIMPNVGAYWALKPETTAGTMDVKNPKIMPAHAPIRVVFFEYSPQTYGPKNVPARVPHENDISVIISFGLNAAMANDRPTNTTQKMCIRDRRMAGKRSADNAAEKGTEKKAAGRETADAAVSEKRCV